MEIKYHTRRNFIKSIGLIFTAAFLLLWRGLINKIIDRRRKKKTFLPKNLSSEITLLSEIIIIKKKEYISVYSSKCTHLGCRINNQKGDNLICPCHGSVFNNDGRPIKGPAVNRLKKLAVFKDSKNGHQFVYVD